MKWSLDGAIVMERTWGGVRWGLVSWGGGGPLGAKGEEDGLIVIRGGLTWLSVRVGRVELLKWSAWVVLHEHHCVATFVACGHLDFCGLGQYV